MRTLRLFPSIFVVICGIAQCCFAAQDAVDEKLKAGNEAVAARKYIDALSAYREANKRQGNNCSVCYIGLTNTYVRLGDERNAVESVNKAVSSAKTESEKMNALFSRAVVFYHFAGNDNKKLKQEEDDLRAAAAFNSAPPDVHRILGMVLMRELKDDEGKQELKHYLELQPDSKYAADTQKMIADPWRARETMAPEFKITSMQGETLSLDGLTGKVVVLDFWATWCHPCVESVPDIKEVVKKYPREKLVVISVSADQDAKKWEDFIAKKSMNWPQFHDKDNSIREAFGVYSFPTYIIIDPRGAIKARIVGTDPMHSLAYRLKDKLKSMSELMQ